VIHTRRGRAPHHKAPAAEPNTPNAADQPEQRQAQPSAHLVEVRGFAAAPFGRRRFWAIVVPSCPHCGYLHLHRAQGEHGGDRTGSCGRGYRVVIAGQKRRPAA
jgi:hypothetical protein